MALGEKRLHGVEQAAAEARDAFWDRDSAVGQHANCVRRYMRPQQRLRAQRRVGCVADDGGHAGGGAQIFHRVAQEGGAHRGGLLGRQGRT